MQTETPEHRQPTLSYSTDHLQPSTSTMRLTPIVGPPAQGNVPSVPLISTQSWNVSNCNCDYEKAPPGEGSPDRRPVGSATLPTTAEEARALCTAQTPFRRATGASPEEGAPSTATRCSKALRRPIVPPYEACNYKKRSGPVSPKASPSSRASPTASNPENTTNDFMMSSPSPPRSSEERCKTTGSVLLHHLRLPFQVTAAAEMLLRGSV